LSQDAAGGINCWFIEECRGCSKTESGTIVERNSIIVWLEQKNSFVWGKGSGFDHRLGGTRFLEGNGEETGG